MIIKTAIGVFLALLLMFFVRIAYVNYVANEIATSIIQTSKEQQDRITERLRQQQVKTEAQKRKALLEKQEEQRITELEIDFERKKDKAWFNYYIEPKECLSYKSNQHMVECSNKRIRARRDFEILWAENKVP